MNKSGGNLMEFYAKNEDTIQKSMQLDARTAVNRRQGWTYS